MFGSSLVRVCRSPAHMKWVGCPVLSWPVAYSKWALSSKTALTVPTPRLPPAPVRDGTLYRWPGAWREILGRRGWSVWLRLHSMTDTPHAPPPITGVWKQRAGLHSAGSYARARRARGRGSPGHSGRSGWPLRLKKKTKKCWSNKRQWQ